MADTDARPVIAGASAGGRRPRPYGGWGPRLAAAALPLALLPVAACNQGDSIEDLRGDGTSSGLEADARGGTKAGKAKAGTKGRAAATPPAAGQTITPRELRRLIEAGMRASTTAHLTMTSTGGVSEMRGEGDVDYTTSPPSTALTMSVGGLGGQQVEARLVGGTVYMRIPGATGGKFLAFDLRDPNNPLGQDFALQMDPESQLDALTRGVRRVVFVGSRGGRDHYRLTAAVGQMAESLGAQGAAGLPGTLTYDIWFDSQQRMRRLVLDVGGPAGRLEMTLDDHDQPVDIRKPPPAQVTRAPGAGAGA